MRVTSKTVIVSGFFAVCGCATAVVFEDDLSAQDRGWFKVERAENGSYFGNLSGYVAESDPRGEGVNREFWLRAGSFCKGEVQRLTDQLCIVELKVGSDPSGNYGQCKMGHFRCANPP